MPQRETRSPRYFFRPHLALQRGEPARSKPAFPNLPCPARRPRRPSLALRLLAGAACLGLLWLLRD